MFQVGSAVQKPPDWVRGGQGQCQALGQKVGWWQLGQPRGWGFLGQADQSREGTGRQRILKLGLCNFKQPMKNLP